MTTPLAIAMVAAASTATAATALLIRVAPGLGLIDVPNERSSHVSPTARGGGLAVLAGLVVGLVLVVAAIGRPGRALIIIAIGFAALALVGAVDDRFSLPAWSKFAVQLVIAIGVVLTVGPVNRLPLPQPLDVQLAWPAWPLTILWLLGVTNFYNFMDGIDGLAASQAVSSCLGAAVAGWSSEGSEFALILLAAVSGFLFFGRPPARVFLGDAGSTSIGFGLAAMPLLAPMHTRWSALLVIALGLSLFLLDPLETLVRLVRGRRPLGVAHRLHSYQLMATSTQNPALVSSIVAICGLVLALAAGLSFRLGWSYWPTLVLASAIFVAERYLSSNPRLLPRRNLRA